MVYQQNGTERFLFTEKPEIVPFSFGFDRIDQGRLAQLTCVISHGDMPLKITWSLKGDLISHVKSFIKHEIIAKGNPNLT